MHAQLDSRHAPLGDTQVLDAVAEFTGKLDILGRHALMPSQYTARKIQGHGEGHGRQDGQLVRRVDTLDVKARIGLGVAQGLGLGEHVGKSARPRSISVRMKLPVPLMMPPSESTRFAPCPHAAS
jgi:hypothetical protein